MESQPGIDSAFDPNLLELSTKNEVGTLDGPDCFSIRNASFLFPLTLWFASVSERLAEVTLPHLLR